jgi:hypothetical protein
VFFKEFRSLSDNRKEVIRGTGHAYSLFLRSILEEGQQNGEVDRSLNPRMATAGVVGMLNSMSYWYQDGGSWGPDKIGSQFAEQAVMGLVSEGHLSISGGRESLLEAIRQELA